ncbi:MAG: DoxX family protein [Thermoplasmata archaeon]|nr:DoxX family protein [Thermoplasmata archaeon]
MTAPSEADGWTGNWWSRNVSILKTLFRVLFGLIWLIDGAFKFAPGFVDSFTGSVSPDGQPAWLSGWFTFWANQTATTSQAAFWVYFVGSLELSLGLALIFGFMRKVAYIGGALLSLFIWAVPETFGGPYGPSSTDIGTGAVYAMLFFSIIVINAMAGPSRWSLDYYIEKRVRWWAYFAEFGVSPAPASSSKPVATGETAS